MGKGDRKTRKGKIAIRSYGNSRPHAAVAAGAKTGTAKPAARTAAAARPAVKKAPAVRKAAPKKSA